MGKHRTYTSKECSREAPGYEGFHVVHQYLIAYFVPGFVLDTGDNGVSVPLGGREWGVLPEVITMCHILVAFL